MRDFLRIKINFLFLFLVFSTILNSQTYSLEFSKAIHNFGEIKLNSGSHANTFVFTNISKQPQIVQMVISSCGCTSPEWTKTPVFPGDSGYIKVTFLNNQGPYPFDKSLKVYVIGETKPYILRIIGDVKEGSSSIPLVDTCSIDVGRISMGKDISAKFRVKNIGTEDLIINKIEANFNRSSTKYTSIIHPGESAVIEVNIDTKGESGEKGYIFSVFTNSSYMPEFFLIVTAHIFLLSK